MKKYKQLSLENRHQIKALLNAGLNQSEIAKNIGVHRSTICRELTRNVAKRGPTAKQYIPLKAEEKTMHRHQTKPKRRRFSELLKKQTRQWLTEEKLSPELITARWKLSGQQGVSGETLYRWIWQAKHNKDPVDRLLYKHLKHGRRKRRRGHYQDSRGHLRGRVPISQRPKVVDKRRRIGDLEVDLMMGKAHKSALLVITDRATLLIGIEKVTTRKADPITEAILSKLSGFSSAWIKTITVDNDKAFARHRKIAQALNAKVFFTRPYTSQDKGTVENRIGVLRRFFPKGTDLRPISKERIQKVERYLNNRPIRKFNYLSPIQQSLTHRRVALMC